MRGENIFLYALQNQKGLRRIVISVSSKVGKSVVRNRIKRVYREIFRKNKEIFPESCDIIISPFKNVSNYPQKVLLDELIEILSKLRKKEEF